jgi:hypothetical protein
MKIAIIGAGWTGCHLANALMDEHDIVIFDKEGVPFAGTSQINQNRLHLGYHYARNKPTRDLCRTTFDRFMSDYGHLTNAVERNLYAVSADESLMDFGTIDQIFPCDEWHHEKWSAPFLRNTEAVINTGERFISPLLAQNFFASLLSDLFIADCITGFSVEALRKDYDLVLDCTNNTLLLPSHGDYFEAVAMFLYSPIGKLPFDALTYIDGPLFSLFPYEHGLLSLSHVSHSVIAQSISPTESHIPYLGLKEARENVERHLAAYWPDAKSSLSYVDTVVSMKSKRVNSSACRTPLFKQDGNLLSCFTGKIQGIYAIEDYVRLSLTR